MLEQKEMMIDQMNIPTDNAVEVIYNHETTFIPKLTPHRSDIILHHEIEIIMTEALLLKNIKVLDITTINKILDPIVLHIDHTNHLTDGILVLNTDHVLIQKTTILQNILLYLHLLQDQEILNILGPALTLIQEITSIQYKPNQ